MAGSYKYRPKGIDIRITPTKGKPKPEHETCNWAGCESPGGCKAPKSPDRLREYYNFCQKHAREYNKNWNFFSGMSDEDIAEWQVGARHGHRPTWDVRKNTSDRAQAQKNRRAGAAGAAAASYDIFGGKDGDGKDMLEAPRKKVSKMALKALADLGLDDTADPKTVRRRYTELVKRFHPDANQGSREAEESFQRVVKAYKVLKGANLG